MQGNNPPKVSILVPAYNVEQYIVQAMDSLVKQTLEDIQIVCINDGSTDNTLEYLNRYAEKDDRVLVIDKKNGGYGIGMNVALDHATGEYIGILEPDDYVPVRMFEDLYNKAKENDLDFIKADFYRFAEEGNSGNIKFNYFHLSKNPNDYNVVFNPSEKPEATRYEMNTWSGIYKRSFLLEHGIRHHETPGASFQDMSFHYMVLTAAKSVYFLNKYYYHYRKDNEASSVKSGEKVYCIFDETSYYEHFLDCRPADKARLIKPYMAWKFKHYNWNYNRVYPQFQWAFLMRARNEFLAHRAAGLLEEQFFSAESWKALNEILDHPVFYFKNTCKNRNGWLSDNLDAIRRDVPEQIFYTDIQLICEEYENTNKHQKSIHYNLSKTIHAYWQRIKRVISRLL